MKISKGIGIDLGTTNSAVAIMDITDSDIIMSTNKQGAATTPSVVWFDPKKKDRVVGKLAFQRRGSVPEPIVSIKRWMGTNRPVKLGGQDMLPEEVSAEILKELRAQIETKLAEMSTPEQTFVVDRAIITIPAYFQLPAIEATRKAGELAGLEIIELLHEPTAAAVHYSWKHNLADDCTFMVFDPGGGTFDVAILRRTAGEPEVLGISGDTFLGGDDLDRRLAEYIRRKLMDDPESEYDLNLDVESDPEDKLRFTQLVLLAEGVKKQLSNSAASLLRDSTIFDKNNNRIFIEMNVERDQFENEITDLVDRMIPKCWEALAKAHKRAEITLKDIDYILLVGGTSYVPLVQHKAQEAFCDYDGARPLTDAEIEDIANQIVEEHRETARVLMRRRERARCSEPVFEDPDTCNARGAAIRAALDGLAVYNDEQTLRVIFRGQGTTASTKANIAGRVETAHDDPNGKANWQPLEGGRVELILVEANYREDEFLDAKGNFRFRNVPLQAGTINQFSVNVYTADNQKLASVGRPIAQDVNTVSIGSKTLTTAVLPTPIRIEGIIDGRIGRKDLIPESESLPLVGQFTFRLDENPGYVVIPIFQGTRLIKEINQDIDPNLPPGTPIEFWISVDDKLYITCKGKIGDTEFAVAIEPAPLKVPTVEEVAQKEVEFDEALAYRSIGDAAVLRAKMRSIRRDIADARESGEEPKVIERFEALCSLVEEAKKVTARLNPPKEQFDELVRACLQFTRDLAQLKPDLNLDEVEKNIRTQQQVGDAAAQAMNQPGYADAFQMLVDYAQGLREEIEGATRSGGRSQPMPESGDPVTETLEMIAHLRGVCAQLRPYAVTRATELRDMARKNPDKAKEFERQAQTAQATESRLIDIDRALAQLEPTTRMNPQDAQRKVQPLRADLQRSYNILENLGDGSNTGGRIRI